MGNLEREDFYSNNMLNGKSTGWDKDGVKISEENYLNDTLHEEYREYHINGQDKVIGFYNKGLYDKTWTYWSQIGLKIGEGKYENGTGKLVSWYPNGKVMREIYFKENEKDGEEIHYLQDGSIEKSLIYENGIFVEEIVTDSISGSQSGHWDGIIVELFDCSIVSLFHCFIVKLFYHYRIISLYH